MTAINLGPDSPEQNVTTNLPESAGSDRTSPVSPRRAWIAVGIILVGETLDLLDSLVTVTAGPKIMSDLRTNGAFIQWLGAGYTVAMAAGLLIGGRLGDIFGRRRLFLIGMAGFTMTSLLSALATTPEMLITCRVLQGLLGALMVPQALGMIREMFPPERVGIALGLTGPVLASAGVIGPVFAGWLVDADYFGWGWRMIFAINVPIGVVAIFFGLVFLPVSRPNPSLRLDMFGAFLAATAMTVLVFPLVEGQELGWPWWTWPLLVGGAGLLGGFVRYQIHLGRGGRTSPLVEPSLFGKRAFVAGLGVGTMYFAVLVGDTFLLSIFLQVGLGLTPLQAGLILSTQAVGMIIGFVLSQALGLRRRTMHVGLATTLAGIVLTILSIGLQGDHVTALWLSIPLTLVGIGSGLVIAPFFGIVLAGVDELETGSASGALTSAQQVGNSLGVAVLGSVFFALAGSPVSAHSASRAAQIALFCAGGFVVAAAILTTMLPVNDNASHSGDSGAVDST